MTDPIFLKNARFVLSMDEGKIYENTNLRIEEGTISGIGELDSSRGDEIIDCSGSIVMPGIVNSHTHAAMVLLRGLNDDAPLQEWLESMWAVETKFKPKIEQMGAEMGFLEMIRTGTTACIDMYGADTAAAAASSVGIRLGAGVPLISIFGKTEDRLAAGRKFIDEHRDYDRVIPMVNLHSIYTNDEEAMVKAGELSREKDVLLNVHCSETRKEVFGNKRDHGRLAVEELDEHGALWEKSVLAHLGWAASWEFNRIKERGASVVHCPNSNQKLATGGFFPFKDLKDLGVAVGLGTDGAASNNSLDMFREMKAMALLQKGQYWDPTATFAEDPLVCSTVNGNSILGTNGGMVKEGMNADLCILDIDPLIMPLRKDNLMSALVYSAVGNLVKGTMIGGDVVYNDGKLPDGSDWKERYMELSGKCTDGLEM